jgi:hypothetical protein
MVLGYLQKLPLALLAGALIALIAVVDRRVNPPLPPRSQ